MTVPAAAAWIGVPYGTPMSIPGWISQMPFRQRGPNGLVIGPCTGQMNPADEGVAAGAPDVDDDDARIFAASAALSACSPFISTWNAFSFVFTCARFSRFVRRAAPSCTCDEISCWA